MEKYTPSLDWGDELVTSLIWIVKAWGISAVCLLVVVALIFRYTVWGRQFWRITAKYFTGPASVGVWLLFGVLLLSAMISVRFNVLFSFFSNDMFTAVQAAGQGAAAGDAAVRESGIHGFWVAILTFCLLATIHVARVLLDLYLTQRFIIAWRVWLTDHLTGDWLDQHAYYRARFIDHTIDNPDQRIQQDIDIFTTGAGGDPNSPGLGTSSLLLFGAIEAVANVVSFSGILWGLSGPLTFDGVTLPRALFWVVIVYVLAVSIVAFWIGRPLIGLSFRNELLNAAFRYGLVRLRDAAEAVGFYRGERVERGHLHEVFMRIIANYRRYVNRTVRFAGWNLSASQLTTPIPWMVQAPRLFSGAIKLGGVTQSTHAFGSIETSLSFFRNAYDSFAGYRAAILRLHGLVEANTRARELPTLTTEASPDGSVHLDGVAVRTPSGTRLIDALDVHLDRGDSMVVVGPSGVGKTSLLRSLAQLWPFASGTVSRPDGDTQTMFLSQLPYVPLGDLRAVVCYPNPPGSISDDTLRATLAQVALAPLADRLDEEQDWAKVLSPGEQQRVAFARILLTKPQAVFLDEATSALDEGLEFVLYELLRNELPDCVVVSVSHRHTVEQHHERLLELLGEGRWQLRRVEEEPTRV
jgi:putative ATP-binding cassette transporter